MHVIVDFTVIPMGTGVSISSYVAEVESILEEAGLTHTLHANGTNIEGEWDTVFAAVKRCHETIHRMGAPRIFATLHVGTRTDRAQTMADKLGSVEAKRRKSGAGKDG